MRSSINFNLSSLLVPKKMKAAGSEKEARKGELSLREPKAKRGKIDSKSMDSSVVEEKSRKVKNLSEKTESKSLKKFDSSLDALFTESTRAVSMREPLRDFQIIPFIGGG